MILTYSDTADALYINLKPEAVPTQGEEIDSATLVDLDDAGELVGIEVLHPAREWPLDAIADRFFIPMEELLQLRTLWNRSENAPFPFIRTNGRRTLASTR